MLRVGEFERYTAKGTNIITNLTTNYWLITPCSTSEMNIMSSYGYSYFNQVTNAFSIRPSLNLKSNVVITGGDGTKNRPFTIELQ